MLFRTDSMMSDVHDYVRQRLPGYDDPLTRPYTMNHGGLGPITSQSIIERKNEFNLFLSTRYIS
jgi:hypothetical protein